MARTAEVPNMAKKRVFISFDFDHDKSLRGDLVAQSKRPDSPFSIIDCGVGVEARRLHPRDLLSFRSRALPISGRRKAAR